MRTPGEEDATSCMHSLNGSLDYFPLLYFACLRLNSKNWCILGLKIELDFG